MSITAKGHEVKCGYRKAEKDGKDRTIRTMASELNKRLLKTHKDLVAQVTRNGEETSQEAILKNLVGVLESANGSNVIAPSGKVDLTIRARRLENTKAELAKTAREYGFTIRKVGSGVDSRLIIKHDKDTLYDTGPRGMKRITPDYTALFGTPTTLIREERLY